MVKPGLSSHVFNVRGSEGEASPHSNGVQRISYTTSLIQKLIHNDGTETVSQSGCGP